MKSAPKSAPKSVPSDREPRLYEFSLEIDAGAMTDALLDRLYESGCDDGVPVARAGRVWVAFARESTSMADAVLSALGDLRSAGRRVIGADLGNLVTLAEIARRIDRSRETVSKYASGGRGPGRFPRPAVQASRQATVFYWGEVADWLADAELVDARTAADARQADAISGLQRYRGKLTKTDLREIGRRGRGRRAV